MKTKYGKRFMAWLLAVSMVLSSAPQTLLPVSAAEIIVDDAELAEVDDAELMAVEVDDSNAELELSADSGDELLVSDENTEVWITDDEMVSVIAEDDTTEEMNAADGTETGAENENSTDSSEEITDDITDTVDGITASSDAEVLFSDETGFVLAVEEVEEEELEEIGSLQMESLSEVLLSDGTTADFSWYQAEKTTFKLSTAEELRALSELVAVGLADDGYGVVISPDDFAGKTIKLTADVELGEWTPVGTSERPFAGTFDGQGHTISYRITGEDKEYQGLFASNSGTLKNFHLSGNISLSTSRIIGGAAAYNTGTISDVTTSMQIVMNDTHTNSSSDIAARNGCYLGGIAGYNYGTVKNCSNTGYIEAGTFVGGIVGHNFSTVANCRNSGQIICRDLDCNYSSQKGIGGIVGVSGAASGYTARISNCSNSGEILGYFNAGGIAGFLNSSAVVNCYNTGHISGCWDIGGIAGAACGGTFSGATGRSSISNCYNIGAIDENITTAAEQGLNSLNRAYLYTGGIVGFGWSQDLYNCYNGGMITGKQQSGGIMGGDRYGVAAGTVVRCYNMASVTGTSYVGSLIGWTSFATSECQDYSSAISAESAAAIADALNVSVTADNGWFGWYSSGTDVYFGSVYSVDFAVEPEGAKITVKNADDTEVEAAQENIWTLQNGTYTYEVSADGYESQNGTFTVNGTDQTISVTLEKVWTTDSDTSWYSTDQTNFVLTDARQLAGIGALLASGTDFTGKTITLGADIVLDGEWTAIGENEDADYAFNGTLNGAGHQISGLSGTALFAAIGTAGIVKNLALPGSGALTEVNNGTIANCKVNTTAEAAAAITNNGTVKNCVSVNAVPVVGTGSTENSYYVNETYTEGQFADGTVAALLNAQVTAASGYLPWTDTLGFASVYTVSFAVATKDEGGDASTAVLTIYDSNGTEITEETTVNYKTGTNTWSLVPGEYTYKATLENYTDREGSFVVKDEDISRTIVMAKRCAYTFTVTDKVSAEGISDASVKVLNAAGQSEAAVSAEGGVVTYNLEAGSYTWIVSCEGYPTESGSFEIAEGAEAASVSVELKKYPVLSFMVTPEEVKDAAEIVVKDAAGKQVFANTDGTYSLTADGTYAWTVSAEGYWTESGSVDAAENAEVNVEYPVNVEMCRTYRVSFAYDEASATAQNKSLVVKDADGNVLDADEDMTWLLKSGTYTYVAEAYGFEAVEAEFTVEDAEQEITISFTEDAYDKTWYDASATELTIEDNSDFMAFVNVSVGRAVNASNEMIAADTFTGKTIKLNADITLTEAQNKAFVPIGSKEAGGTGFRGTFNGNGHTITLNIASESYQYLALFGYAYDCVISNLTIAGSIANNYPVTSSKRAYTAALIAYSEGATGNTISITECTNATSVTAGQSAETSVYGYYYTGGLIAYINRAHKFTDCVNTGAVTGRDYTGGILGWCQTDNSFVGCTNTGAVTGTKYTGGIVSYYGNMTGCTNEGTVTGTEYVGGLSGYTSSTLTGCTNKGAVTGTKYVGGLAGYHWYGAVNNCENTAAVNGETIVGGLFGYLQETGTVSNNNVNRAAVTASGMIAGGIAGQYRPGSYNPLSGAVNFGYVRGQDKVGGLFGQMDNTSNTAEIRVQNCYSVAQVSADEGTNIGGICGYDPTNTIQVFKNCFYLSSVADTGCPSNNTGCTAVGEDEFESVYTAMNLNVTVSNGAYLWEEAEDGYIYPTGSAAQITFTATPDYASFTLQDAEGNVISPIFTGSASYAGLTKNAYYEYTAASTSDDYYSASGVLKYTGTALTQSVELESKKYTITFDLTPAYANVAVYDESGNEITQSGTNKYSLPVGEYTYAAAASGYQTAVGSFTVGGSEENRTRTITVELAQGTKVTFETNVKTPEYQTITVYDSESNEVLTEKEGVYYLAAGDYTYKIAAEGYETLSGEGFTVGEDAQIIEAELTMNYDISWYDKGEAVYELSDVYQMKGLHAIVSGSTSRIAQDVMKDKTVRLTSDLTLDGAWVPLGYKSWSSYGSFAGKFDGCGHVITMEAPTISIGYAGLFYALAETGRITNLTIDGTVGSSSVSNAAAFVSYISYGTISGCINLADVTASSMAAGFIGSAMTGMIENCRNEGAITCTGSNYAGGLAANNGGASMKNCTNGGSVTGGKYTGGLVGYFQGGSGKSQTIENCYNTAAISTTVLMASAGGLIGYIDTSSRYARTMAANCYNSGIVSASARVAAGGALAGATNSVENVFEDCYFAEGTAEYSHYATAYAASGYKSITATEASTFTDGTAAKLLNENVTETNGYYQWMVKGKQTVFSYGNSLIFTLNPADAQVVLCDASGNVITQSGKNCYAGLTEGSTYTYTVTKDGLNTDSGSITIGSLPSEVVSNLSATILLTVSKDGTFFKGYDAQEGTSVNMSQVPVTVTAFDVTEYGMADVYNSEDGPTLLHAFIRAHELYCEDGAEGFAGTRGYEGEPQGNDFFITEFWGVEYPQMNYWVNNAYPGEWLEEEGYVYGSTADNIYLVNGDDAEVDLYTDYQTPMYHTYFDQTSVTIMQGETLNLTLKGFASADGYKYVGVPDSVAMKGSEIYADAVGTENDSNKELPYASMNVKTDENGLAELVFDTPGTYYVSAKGTETLLGGSAAVITAPYCTVTVLENEAYEVIKLIDSIGIVTLESSAVIAEVRAAYDALSEDAKQNVFNYAVLTDAEASYQKQTEDAEAAAKAEEEAKAAAESKAKVDAVIAQIEAIGDVTLDDQAAIKAARAAYDALTDEQKASVTNASDLTSAEKIYNVVAASAAKEQAAADAAAKAEAEKNAANEAATKAEAEKAAAEAAKAKAEAEKAAAEAAKARAEADKKAAEEAKAQAEADKKAAEEVAQNAAAESGYVKQTAAKTNSITVQWSADDDADAGYRIYIKNSSSKKYTKVADVSASRTSYTIKKAGGKKLTAGKTWYVQVVSLQKVNGKKTEISSCITKAVTITAKPKISSAKRAKSSITLNWKKVTGANGYEIQMSTKKKSGYETVAAVSSAKKSYKVTGLARKTTYYFRIRTYKTVNGETYYSSWSTAKRAKTK